MAVDFGVEFDMAELQLYKDEEQEGKGTPDREEIPDNYYDQYLNAKVLYCQKGSK